MKGSVLEQELLLAEASMPPPAPLGQSAAGASKARLVAIGLALVLHCGLILLAYSYSAEPRLPFRPEDVIFVDLRQPLLVPPIPVNTETDIAAPSGTQPLPPQTVSSPSRPAAVTVHTGEAKSLQILRPVTVPPYSRFVQKKPATYSF